MCPSDIPFTVATSPGVAQAWSVLTVSSMEMRSLDSWASSPCEVDKASYRTYIRARQREQPSPKDSIIEMAVVLTVSVIKYQAKSSFGGKGVYFNFHVPITVSLEEKRERRGSGDRNQGRGHREKQLTAFSHGLLSLLSYNNCFHIQP